MVPIIELDYILLLGIVFYVRNIILLGLTTKKTLLKFIMLYITRNVGFNSSYEEA